MIKFENKNNGRYYYLFINRDIFGEFVLTTIRGGLNVRVMRHFGFNDLEKIHREIDRIKKRRLQRGYTLVQ